MSSQAENEMALGECADAVVLAGPEVDQARRGECSLAAPGADLQQSPGDQHERVLVLAVLWQGLSCFQQHGDDTVAAFIAQDLRLICGGVRSIELPSLHAGIVRVVGRYGKWEPQRISYVYRRTGARPWLDDAWRC